MKVRLLFALVGLAISFALPTHALGTAGNELWATGKWSQTLKGQNGSIEVKGYWSAIDILEGDDWKFRMLCYNLTLVPTATPSQTASPSSQ